MIKENLIQEFDNLTIICLDEEIGEVSEYRELFTVFKTDYTDHTIRIILNNNGGDLDTGLVLYNLIRECNATVIAEVYKAHSASTIIAMACDGIEVKDFGYMMIHNIHWGSGEGSHNTIKGYTDFLYKYNEEIVKTVYDKFLTPAEIEGLLQNKDIWLNKSEIEKRFARC